MRCAIVKTILVAICTLFSVSMAEDGGANRRERDDSSGRPGRDRKRKLDIEVFEPLFLSNSVTLFIPGRNLSPVDYASTIDLMLAKEHTVVFFPTISDDLEYAESVPLAFDQYTQTMPVSHRKSEYNLLGHSYGAKIVLIASSVFDSDRVRTVISLDPVDMNPPRFTNANATENISLKGIREKVYLTITDGGGTIDPSSQADTIVKYNSDLWLWQDFGAGHLAYCDPNPGVRSSTALKLMRATIFPKQEGDASALDHAYQMINDFFV